MTAPTSRQIVAHLKKHGSRERAAGVQWFFKEEIRSHGWRTADLRRYARDVSRSFGGETAALLDVAEALFAGEALEEKALGVLVLQPSLRRFGDAEFRRFAGWLPKVSTWADHDALAMFLLGPMMTAEAQGEQSGRGRHVGRGARRVRRVRVWARSRSRWLRRAAAVSLIDGVRHGLFSELAEEMTRQLLRDRDDMVQKGLGWLLREWGKVRPQETIPLLMAIKGEASRLVLRTACERLPAAARLRVLAK